MWYNDRTAEQLGLLDSSSHGFCWNCSGKSIEEWECNSFFVNCLNTSVMTIQLIQLSRFGLEVGNPCDAGLKRKHTCHHVADCLKYVPSLLYATHVVLFRFVSGSQKGHLYVAVLPDVYLSWLEKYKSVSLFGSHSELTSRWSSSADRSSSSMIKVEF